MVPSLVVVDYDVDVCNRVGRKGKAFDTIKVAGNAHGFMIAVFYVVKSTAAVVHPDLISYRSRRREADGKAKNEMNKLPAGYDQLSLALSNPQESDDALRAFI
jgi:hypothetical protein